MAGTAGPRFAPGANPRDGARGVHNSRYAGPMPGPVSDTHPGPPEDGPYVPSWCYPRGPKMCPCGHHEGFHAGAGGACLRARECRCAGLPAECFSSDAEMLTPEG